jgi:hypothetical protein
MGRFQLIVLLVASILYFYLGFRLSPGEGLAAGATWLWLGFCFLMVLLLPFYFWSRRKKEMTAGQKLLMKITQASMAYLNFLIPLVLARDFVSILAHVLFQVDVAAWFSPLVNLIFLVVPLLLKVWGMLTIVRGPQIVHQELRDERLPKEFEGFRILQVSDLHISSSLKTGFVEKVLRKAEEAKPDLIVLTGDIVDGSPVEFRDEIAKLSRLRAPSGVIFVPGNHEYYWDFPLIRGELEKTGMSILINEGKSIRRGDHEMWIGGIPDPASRSFGQEPPIFDKLVPQFRDGQYRVLLSHQPVLADAAAEAGFHLQFSGHTHAGQFFPWNLLIGFFQKYAKGFYRIGKLHLYVNQGTGYWGPALRVGTFCEMTELTLHV